MKSSVKLKLIKIALSLLLLFVQQLKPNYFQFVAEVTASLQQTINGVLMSNTITNTISNSDIVNFQRMLEMEYHCDFLANVRDGILGTKFEHRASFSENAASLKIGDAYFCKYNDTLRGADPDSCKPMCKAPPAQQKQDLTNKGKATFANKYRAQYQAEEIIGPRHDLYPTSSFHRETHRLPI